MTSNFIQTYFAEEKISAYMMVVIGSLSLLLALTFLCIIKYTFFKGMAIPLLVIGVLQVCVGTIIVVRSPNDIIRVNQQLTNEPYKIKSEELPRMETVLKKFSIYKWVELAMFLIGIVLFALFYNSTQTFWKGLGLGLLLQCGIIFTLDFIAEKRAEIYVSSLKKSI